MNIKRFFKKAAAVTLAIGIVTISVPAVAAPIDSKQAKVTFSVSKDTPVIPEIDETYLAVTYDGEEHIFPNVQLTVTSGELRDLDPSTDVMATYYISSDNGNTWDPGSTIRPTATNVVDSALVKVVISSPTHKFSDVEMSPVNFEIKPREIEITAEDASKKWGEVDPAFEYYISPSGTNGIVSDTDRAALNIQAVRDFSDTSPEDPGDHPIKITYTPNSNYKITANAGTLDIDEGILDRVGEIDDIDVFYDGLPHSIDVSSLTVGATTETFRDVSFEVSNDGESYAASATNPIVTDANVSSTGEETKEYFYTGSSGAPNNALHPTYVKVRVTGQNDTTKTFGPFRLAVKKIPVNISWADNEFPWDIEEHKGAEPSIFDIWNVANVLVGGNGELAGDDRITPGTAGISLPSGTHTAGREYGMIYKIAPEEGGIDIISSSTGLSNIKNYEISISDAIYVPTNAALDVLRTSFNVTYASADYDGRTHYIKGTGAGEATLTYSTDGGESWHTFDDETVGIRDAGTVTARIRATLSDGSYVEREASLTINKLNAVIAATAGAQKKEGDADPVFTATATGFISGEEPQPGVDYKVIRSNTDETAGVYTGVIKVNLITTSWRNYNVTTRDADFRITDNGSAYLDGISVTRYSGSYDGNPHGVTVNGVTDDAIAAGAAITYSTDGGSTWSRIAPVYKDVTLSDDGTSVIAKNIIVRATVGNTYKDFTSSIRIGRKTAYIRAKASSKREGEEDPAFTATVSGAVGSETFDYDVLRTDAGDETVGVHNGVIQVFLKDEYPDYSLHLVSAAFTINRGQAYSDVQKFEATGYNDDYDGEYHKVTIKTAVKGSEVTYSTDNGDTWTSTAPSVKHVKDSVSVWVKCAKGGYEKIVKTNITVTRKEAKISVNDATKVQGEAMPSFSADVSGLAGHDRIDYTLSYSGTDTAGVHSGSIRATVAGEYPDYTITVKNGTLTITAKTIPDPVYPITPTPDTDTSVSEVIRDDGERVRSEDDNEKAEESEETEEEQVTDLIDHTKYLVDPPEEDIGDMQARFVADDESDAAVIRDGEKISISSDSAAKAGGSRIKAGAAAPLIVGGIVTAAVAVGLGVKGAWSALWLLLIGLLFAKKRKKWHGLLTYENSAFIKVEGDTDGVEDMQDIINKGVTSDELRALMEDTNVMTILPAKTKMTLDVDGDGEQHFDADEEKFYEILSNAEGHVITTIYNEPLRLSFTIEYDPRK